MPLAFKHQGKVKNRGKDVGKGDVLLVHSQIYLVLQARNRLVVKSLQDCAKAGPIISADKIVR